MEKVIEFFQNTKSNSRVDPPLKIYQPKMVPRFAKQLVVSESTFWKENQHYISH